MNIRELKDLIKDIDDNTEVILQKDGEGNGYSPLSGGDCEAIYVPDSTWSGEVYSLEWTADDCCLDEDEWERIKKKHPKALILYPIN